MRFTSTVLLIGLMQLLTLPAIAQQPLDSTAVDWVEMKTAMKRAAADGKKVLLYGRASWCGYCKKMERLVYSDPKVADSLSQYFHPVQITTDSDDSLTFRGETMHAKEMAARLNLRSTPTHYFITSEGEFIAQQPGYLPSDVFIPLLVYIGRDLYEEQDFDAFLEQMQ